MTNPPPSRRLLAVTILRAGLEETAPIRELLVRLQEPDGARWFDELLSGAEDRTKSLDECRVLKREAKKSTALESREERVRGFGLYLYSLAAALVEHGRSITSQERATIDEVLLDLAEAAPEPWSGVFSRAAQIPDERARDDSIFPATQITQFHAALAGGEDEKPRLNQQVMEHYYVPLINWASRKYGRKLSDPVDFVHGFFASRLSQKSWMSDWSKRWQKHKMPFRWWLKKAVRLYFLETRHKKGPTVELNLDEIDAGLKDDDPEYDIDCAQEMAGRAIARLERILIEKNLEEHWAEFQENQDRRSLLCRTAHSGWWGGKTATPPRAQGPRRSARDRQVGDPRRVGHHR